MPVHREKYVFISYSRGDSKFARRLISAIKENGINYWIDENKLKAGDFLLERILPAIEKSESFLVLLSSESVESSWVKEELQYAMNLQMRGKERFVIPVIINPCVIPEFLRGRLHIDFTDPKKFKEKIGFLIRSIDAPEYAEEEQYHAKYPDRSTLERITATPDLKNSEWFEAYKEMPLVQQCYQAFKLGSYGGQFRRNLVTALVFASNEEGGIEFNNLGAMIGFLKDLPSPLSRDALSMMQSLIENKFIGTDYRLFIAHEFISRCEEISDRNLRLRVLPEIFPVRGTDSLANRLIGDFFSEKSDLLAAIWRSGSSYYREDLWMYLARISQSSAVPKSREAFFLEDDLNLIVGRVKGHWKKPSTKAGADLTIPVQMESLNSEDDVARLVELLELLSSSMDNKMLLTISEQLGRIPSATGAKRYCYNFLVDVISSPNIDVTISSLALWLLVANFEFQSLYFHDSFPNCLIRKKEAGLFPKVSVIGGLISELSASGDAIDTLQLITRLMEDFPIAPFLAAISIEIKRHPLTEPLEILLNYIHGERTTQAIHQYINERMEKR